MGRFWPGAPDDGIQPEAPQGPGPGRWKVKIRDRERLEPPHVPILFKSTLEKRLDLRTAEFLEQDSSWHGIPVELRATIQESWELLRAEWDAMYPGNPVGGTQ